MKSPFIQMTCSTVSDVIHSPEDQPGLLIITPTLTRVSFRYVEHVKYLELTEIQPSFDGPLIEPPGDSHHHAAGLKGGKGTVDRLSMATYPFDNGPYVRPREASDESRTGGTGMRVVSKHDPVEETI